MVGINPGRVSAAAAAHFANPRNDFWRLLEASGLTPELLGPERQAEVLDLGIGITNAAPRTTPGSGDLRAADFAGSAQRLERIARELRPAVMAFVGKEAYRGAFGERPDARPPGADAGGDPTVRPAVDLARQRRRPWAERLHWFSELASLVDAARVAGRATLALRWPRPEADMSERQASR